MVYVGTKPFYPHHSYLLPFSLLHYNLINCIFDLLQFNQKLGEKQREKEKETTTKKEAVLWRQADKSLWSPWWLLVPIACTVHCMYMSVKIISEDNFF